MAKTAGINLAYFGRKLDNADDAIRSASCDYERCASAENFDSYTKAFTAFKSEVEALRRAYNGRQITWEESHLLMHFTAILFNYAESYFKAVGDRQAREAVRALI